MTRPGGSDRAGVTRPSYVPWVNGTSFGLRAFLARRRPCFLSLAAAKQQIAGTSPDGETPTRTRDTTILSS
jgi:hypothetical protein